MLYKYKYTVFEWHSFTQVLKSLLCAVSLSPVLSLGGIEGHREVLAL